MTPPCTLLHALRGVEVLAGPACHRRPLRARTRTAAAREPAPSLRRLDGYWLGRKRPPRHRGQATVPLSGPVRP